MIAPALKAIVSKDVVRHIFQLNRSGWDSYAREWIPPKGWKVQLERTEDGCSILEHDPAGGMELIIRPYYENAIDPPEVLFVEIHYPVGRAPKFTSEFKSDLQYEVKKSLGPEHSVSVAYMTSSSFMEIELSIKKTGR